MMTNAMHSKIARSAACATTSFCMFGGWAAAGRLLQNDE
jgi:hypothetical protein